MSRIRSIKPEFFTSLTIADLTLSARLTFIGLWCYVDDNGVGVDDARLIRAAIWPLEEDPEILQRTREDLRGLQGAGLIVRYTVAQKPYLAVRSWSEHQKISHPGKPRYPTPEHADPVKDDLLRRVSGGSPEASGDLPRHESEDLRKGSEEGPSGGSPEDRRNASGASPDQGGSDQPTPSDQDSCAAPESSGNPPETHRKTPEALRPEQGAGSRDRGSREAAPAAPRKPRARPTEAPADFPLTDAMRTWARERGIPAARIPRETERFLDHHRSKGSTFKDWNAAWRTWMSRSNDFAPQQPAHTTHREDIF